MISYVYSASFFLNGMLCILDIIEHGHFPSWKPYQTIYKLFMAEWKDQQFSIKDKKIFLHLKQTHVLAAMAT